MKQINYESVGIYCVAQMQKIRNVKIITKSQDHLSHFLLKHSRTKYFPSVQQVESLFERRILNYKCSYQNLFMIIDLLRDKKHLKFIFKFYQDSLHQVCGETTLTIFFPYNQETLKLYCLKKSKSSICFGPAGGKKSS